MSLVVDIIGDDELIAVGDDKCLAVIATSPKQIVLGTSTHTFITLDKPEDLGDALQYGFAVVEKSEDGTYVVTGWLDKPKKVKKSTASTNKNKGCNVNHALAKFL